MKRRAGAAAAVTGGSGDLKPQLWTLTGTQTGVDTSTTLNFATPVPRGVTTGRYTVMEVLKVFAYMSISTPAEADALVFAGLATSDPGSASTGMVSQPTCFAGVMQRRLITTSGVMAWDSPIVMDLMDGFGNGVLVATDRIFMRLVSSGTGVANPMTIKLLYRLVDIDIAEYVGIVQSQQQAST